MIESLKQKLDTAQTDTCTDDYCTKKDSKIRFSLEKPAKVYIINLIWNDQETRHIETFLALIAIPPNTNMKYIYGKSLSDNYNLKGIIFYGREHYEYAFRDGNFWTFKGLGKNYGWAELIKESIIMNYRPVCVIYFKQIESFTQGIEDYDIKKLEKLACKCDNFKDKFGKNIVDDDEIVSGLFLQDKRDDFYDGRYREEEKKSAKKNGSSKPSEYPLYDENKYNSYSIDYKPSVEKRLEENRLEEKRLEEKRLEDKRKEEKLLEDKRLDDQRLQLKLIEEKKLKEEQLEKPKI